MIVMPFPGVLWYNGLMNINRRNFLGLGAIALANAGCTSLASTAAVHDPALSVFLSDIHVAGKGIKTRWGEQPDYQNPLFEKAVDQILAMRPLPQRVMIFGDIALWFGWHQDYEASLPGINRLKAAGIEVFLTMGNHDKRDVFLRYHPTYAKTSPVPGRIVSKIDLGPADLLLLDSLNEGPGGEGTNNTVSGIFDAAQQDWLRETAKAATRPFFCGTHHPPSELCIGKDNVLGFLDKNAPLFAGWIFGHNHRWYKQWHHVGYSKRHVLRSLCLPSTGWWGDIGLATCRTTATDMTVSLVENDFFFPRPLQPGESRPQEWDDIMAENRGDSCRFRFPG